MIVWKDAMEPAQISIMLDANDRVIDIQEHGEGIKQADCEQHHVLRRMLGRSIFDIMLECQGEIYLGEVLQRVRTTSKCFVTEWNDNRSCHRASSTICIVPEWNGAITIYVSSKYDTDTSGSDFESSLAG